MASRATPLQLNFAVLDGEVQYIVHPKLYSQPRAPAPVRVPPTPPALPLPFGRRLEGHGLAAAQQREPERARAVGARAHGGEAVGPAVDIYQPDLGLQLPSRTSQPRQSRVAQVETRTHRGVDVGAMDEPAVDCPTQAIEPQENLEDARESELPQHSQIRTSPAETVGVTARASTSSIPSTVRYSPFHTPSVDPSVNSGRRIGPSRPSGCRWLRGMTEVAPWSGAQSWR
eukprot:COSAG04_NODE_140_length_23600_cov_1779.264414_2_plen_229_part_00